MHIEPGVVTGAKLILSVATATAAGGVLAASTLRQIRREGAASLLARSVLATIAVFAFFEVLPHWPVGVSEVHLILGSTLFLILGRAPAAIGLAAGLLVQGLVVAPFDLPQYGMNVTTLLVPLFAMAAVADRVIPASIPYAELEYRDVLALSLVYQGGVVAWVAFWALYGHGFTAQTLTAIATFGTAYVAVVALEPLVDLAVLFAVKAAGGSRRRGGLVAPRVFAA